MNRIHFTIALTALLLLAGGIGLVVCLFSEPSVYSLPASDARWVLYPESESITEQEKLAFDGNVKLLSLQQAFVLSRDDSYSTDPQAEKSLKAYCHVLIDLPAKTFVRYSGTGWSTSRGIAYTEVEVFEVYTPEKGDLPPITKTK